jgi:cell division protein FtsB
MHQIFMDFLINEYAHKRTVLLIVDEAQNMKGDALEELRMLSNVNSEKDQLMQVVLAGQPALKETLRSPDLMQFAQRIAVDYHLDSLSLEETCGYIQHRLVTAGAKRDIFTPAACERIHNYSGGTPRLINLLCETVLVYGFADQREMIDVDLVDEMVHERMKDSVVPILNRDVSKSDSQVDLEELEKNFPWIEGSDDEPPELDENALAAERLKAELEAEAERDSTVEKEPSPEDDKKTDIETGADSGPEAGQESGLKPVPGTESEAAAVPETEELTPEEAFDRSIPPESLPEVKPEAALSTATQANKSPDTASESDVEYRTSRGTGEPAHKPEYKHEQAAKPDLAREVTKAGSDRRSATSSTAGGTTPPSNMNRRASDKPANRFVKLAGFLFIVGLILILLALLFSDNRADVNDTQQQAAEHQQKLEQQKAEQEKLRQQAEAMKQERDAALERAEKEKQAKQEAERMAAEKQAAAVKAAELKSKQEERKIAEAKERERKARLEAEKARLEAERVKREAAELEVKKLEMERKLEAERRAKQAEEAKRLEQERLRLEAEKTAQKQTAAETVKQDTKPKNAECEGPTARFKALCR